MHIPDGFIDGKTAAVTAALSVVGVGLALRQVKRELPPARVPLLGLAAAFLFVAQMVNFPVVGGTSGHLIGGVLVAALPGPSAAVVVLATVLMVQCFLFADGGVAALGANVFNLALVAVGGGYVAYRLVCRAVPGIRGRVTGVAFGGWCSTVLAAVGCAGQLAWSGTIGWSVAFPAMTGIHLLIGLGEGLIGALVFLGIQRTRPELVGACEQSVSSGSWKALTGYGAVVVLGLAVFVAPFACPWPDGLESVAARLGFEHRATPSAAVPAPDYQAPGLSNAVAATAVAGAVGAFVVFGLAWLLGHLMVRRTGEAPWTQGAVPPQGTEGPHRPERGRSPAAASSAGLGASTTSCRPSAAPELRPGTGRPPQSKCGCAADSGPP